MNKCSRINCNDDAFAKIFKCEDENFLMYECRDHFKRFFQDNLYPGCGAMYKSEGFEFEGNITYKEVK